MVALRAGAWQIVVTIAIVVALGNAPAAASSSVDTDAIMRHVHALTVDIGPRPHGSDAALRAAAYIERELGAMGLEVERQIPAWQELPAVTVGPMSIMPAWRVHVSDPNLWVRLGPERAPAGGALLLMAHYDTVYGSPGAVDNAVAVGVLIEAARELRRRVPARPVIVAFPAAEEVRMAGARALADALADDVGLAVSFDLVGARGTLALNGLSGRMGADWLAWLARVSRRAGVRVDAPAPHRVVSRRLPQLERSDHAAFAARGVPALHVYSRGKDPVYLPYHTALDTLDQVDARNLADTMRLLRALADMSGPLPAASGDPGVWLPVSVVPVVVPAWLVIAGELALLGWIVLCARRAMRAPRRPRAAGVAGITTITGLPAARGSAGGLLLVLGSHGAGWAIAALILAWRAHASGHPMAWAHEPALHVALSCALALAASAMVLLRLARRWPPTGQARYLVAALAACALAGVALLAAGAPELAWIPLVHGALLGSMAFASRFPAAVATFCLALLPLAALLRPGLLRESVFHGFWMPGVPLAAVLAVLLVPATLGLAYVLRRSPLAPPARGAMIAAASAFAIALVAVTWRQPRCQGDEFLRDNLSCELRVTD